MKDFMVVVRGKEIMSMWVFSRQILGPSFWTRVRILSGSVWSIERQRFVRFWDIIWRSLRPAAVGWVLERDS